MTQLLHNASMRFATSEAVTSAPVWPGVLGEWALTPVSDALLLLVAAAYLGALRRRRRSGSPRWPVWRAVCFLCGLAVIVVALNSAIGVYAVTSHAVHMVQHLLLITVAPVLLALGHPLTLVRESSPYGRETVDGLRHNRVVAAITHPATATACYAVVLVGTHLTGFLSLARAEPWLHGLEEVLYLASGYVFAVPLVAWEPLRWRPPYPARFGLVLFSMAVDTFVGIVLMMTPGPADLNLAGALMWFGGDGLMMAVALVVAAQWVRDPDRSTDTGAYLDRARRAALAGYGTQTGTETDAVLDSADVDDDEAALLAYNRVLAALARDDGAPFSGR